VGFDISAFIVTTRYTHNVKTFAAPTAPGNYLHSTEHTKQLIWYNETPAPVLCANILYFPNANVLCFPKNLRIYIYMLPTFYHNYTCVTQADVDTYSHTCVWFYQSIQHSKMQSQNSV